MFNKKKSDKPYPPDRTISTRVRHGFRKQCRKIIIWLGRLGSKAKFGVLATFFTVVTGCMASFFTDEIKSNFFPALPGHEFSMQASFFWGGVWLSSFCFGLIQWSQARNAARVFRKQNFFAKRSMKINHKLDAMVSRLQTLPADNFLPKYRECYRLASFLTFSTMLSDNRTIEQLEAAVRVVLNGILATAKEFDMAWGDATYSANIMLWRPNNEKLGIILETEKHVQIVNYLPSDLTLAHAYPNLAGVIELIPVLSAVVGINISTEENERDKSCKSVIMPIPKNFQPASDVDSRQKYSMLPGAPWAFCWRVLALFSDIPSLEKMLESSTSIDTHLKNQMKEYFRSGDGKDIGSFASIPILAPTPNAGTSDNPPLGVLNINSNKKDILKDNGQTLFVPLLEPFLILLATLIVERTGMLENARKVLVSNVQGSTAVRDQIP